MTDEVDENPPLDVQTTGGTVRRAEPIDGSTKLPRIEPLEYSSPRSEASPDSPTANAWRFTIAVCLLLVGAMSLSTLRPTIGGRSAMARLTAAKADIDSLELALDAYQVDTNQYPSTTAGLQALIQAPAQVANWQGPYVRAIPPDPWGIPYQYRLRSIGNTATFDLSSAGPDRKFGTGDDIVRRAQNGKP